MTHLPPKLTTALACKVARLDRDRFNEAVAAGYFDCAPKTVAGRARIFYPEDMIALYLYRELMEDGYAREKAGRIACAVSTCARLNPDAKAISYVETYFGSSGDAFPADQVPASADWDETLFSGTDIRKVTTFRISKMKALIAHYTAEEISTFGPED